MIIVVKFHEEIFPSKDNDYSLTVMLKYIIIDLN